MMILAPFYFVFILLSLESGSCLFGGSSPERPPVMEMRSLKIARMATYGNGKKCPSKIPPDAKVPSADLDQDGSQAVDVRKMDDATLSEEYVARDKNTQKNELKVRADDDDDGDRGRGGGRGKGRGNSAEDDDRGRGKGRGGDKDRDERDKDKRGRKDSKDDKDENYEQGPGWKRASLNDPEYMWKNSHCRWIGEFCVTDRNCCHNYCRHIIQEDGGKTSTCQKERNDKE